MQTFMAHSEKSADAQQDGVALDEIDIRLLNVLQRDGRIPNTDLADEVGLTPAPTLRRVRRLEEAGLIRRYVALLDAEKIGRGFLVMVRVTLQGQTKAGFETFGEQMRRRPEVLECYLCLGGTDYLLKVATRDLMEYQRFLVEVLAANPLVQHTDSILVVKQEKQTTALPLERLA